MPREPSYVLSRRRYGFGDEPDAFCGLIDPDLNTDPESAEAAKYKPGDSDMRCLAGRCGFEECVQAPEPVLATKLHHDV